jgi:hypothetical protein
MVTVVPSRFNGSGKPGASTVERLRLSPEMRIIDPPATPNPGSESFVGGR